MKARQVFRKIYVKRAHEKSTFRFISIFIFKYTYIYKHGYTRWVNVPARTDSHLIIIIRPAINKPAIKNPFSRERALRSLARFPAQFSLIFPGYHILLSSRWSSEFAQSKAKPTMSNDWPQEFWCNASITWSEKFQQILTYSEKENSSSIEFSCSLTEIVDRIIYLFGFAIRTIIRKTKIGATMKRWFCRAHATKYRSFSRKFCFQCTYVNIRYYWNCRDRARLDKEKFVQLLKESSPMERKREREFPICKLTSSLRLYTISSRPVRVDHDDDRIYSRVSLSLPLYTFGSPSLRTYVRKWASESQRCHTVQRSFRAIYRDWYVQ